MVKVYDIKSTERNEEDGPGDLGNYRNLTIMHYGNNVSLATIISELSGDEYYAGRANGDDDDAPYDIPNFISALERGQLNGTYRIYDEFEWQDYCASNEMSAD